MCAVAAATAGTGFSSGREVVLFFAQMGRASWIGVAFASAMFGMLCGVVCHFAKQTGAESFYGVCIHVLGTRQGSVVAVVQSLLAAVSAGMMVVVAGAMAALTLALKHAFWIGVVLSVGIALLLCMHRMRGMSGAGMVIPVVCVLFYTALALDPRKITIHQRFEVVPELSGSTTAALMLAMLHAALNASVAGEVTACFANRVEKPIRFGIGCGAIMFLLLSAANAALLRGGEKLLVQALPTVVLAARWGVFGYYAAIVAMWLCAVATLAAGIGSLAGRIAEKSISGMTLFGFFLLGAMVSALRGFEEFIEWGYPLLGCAGAISLTGLACCFERKGICGKPRKSAEMRVKLSELPRKTVDESGEIG